MKVRLKGEELPERLADRIMGLSKPHPIRVGIDGVDGAGKTVLADNLVEPLRRRGRCVIRASIDGFHNPREKRYAKGRHSPEGYFRDSFDLGTVVSGLLQPLGPDGSLLFRRASFDCGTDSCASSPVEKASPNAVLLFDGVFLHRRELLGYWDMTIFLDAPFEVTVRRMANRDGRPSRIDAVENARYVNGQKLYLRECRPKSLATVVVDYTNLERPILFGEGLASSM